LNPSSPGICSGIHPPRKMVVATAAMINKFTNSNAGMEVLGSNRFVQPVVDGNYCCI
jgi:hypothetical protein